MPKLLSEYRDQLREIKGLFGIKIALNKKLTKSDKALITRNYNIYKRDELNLGRFGDINKYVDIDINPRKKLTKSQKAKIRRYHKQFIDMTDSKLYQVYQSKSSQKLKAVQNFAHGRTLPGFKVAFVAQRGSSEKLKIIVDKNGRVKIKTKYLESYYVPFDKIKLINDTKNYINKLIKDNPGDSYNIRVGEDRTILDRIFKQSAYLDIKFLMEKYNKTFNEWLNGLDVNNFKNQKQANKFYNKDKETRAAFRKARKKLNRK